MTNNLTKVRVVTVPLETYRGVKMAAARELKTMTSLLGEAWQTYEQSKESKST
jgi:hypothetical protein